MTTTHAVRTLAQVFEPSMPSIAPTPLVERWVTGSGLPGAGLLLGLAVLAVVALPRAGRPRLAWPVAGALALAGLGVLAIGQLVVTDREALRAQARDLVDAAVEPDRDALRTLLHPDARVRSRFASAQGRDRIIPLAERASGYVSGHTVREVRVDLRGPRVARTQVRVSVQGDAIPPASWWQVDWQRPSDDAPWAVTNVEPIWIQGMTDPAGP